MNYNKTRTADDQSDYLESFWTTTPAERYRYGLLFSMLAGLAAVGFMFWRSRKTLPIRTESSKSESGQRRMARQSKQRTAKRARRAQTGNRKLAA